MIGCVDKAMTKHNIQCARKYPQLEFLQVAKFLTDSEPVSDANTNSPADYGTERSETLTDSTSSEDKCQELSSSKSDDVSSKACIITTKKLSSH